MDDVKDTNLQALLKKYPHVPIEKLKDLLSISATPEQYEKADDADKCVTDKQLKSYILKGIPKNDNTIQMRGQAPRTLKLAVIGETGSGKSSVANTLLQTNAFRTSSSASSETMREQVSTSIHNKFTVVDTPGSWTLPRQDYTNIVKSKRCILLLTHAREALHGRALKEYLQEIQGDPLHDLIATDMDEWRVMAINNNTLTTYEADSQWQMINATLRATYEQADFNLPDLPVWKQFLPSILFVGGLVAFVFIVGMSILGYESGKGGQRP